MMKKKVGNDIAVLSEGLRAVDAQIQEYEVMRGELDARMPAIARQMAASMWTEPVAALPPEPINLGELSRDVEAWLVDARACQAVYQSGNAVSVEELQALVTRAVGLLG